MARPSRARENASACDKEGDRWRARERVLARATRREIEILRNLCKFTNFTLPVNILRTFRVASQRIDPRLLSYVAVAQILTIIN